MSIITAPPPKILERMANAGKPNSKTKEKRMAEGKRIELLGQMSERHSLALASGDAQALLDLAGEYAVLGHGCPDTASRIIFESENL